MFVVILPVHEIKGLGTTCLDQTRLASLSWIDLALGLQEERFLVLWLQHQLPELMEVMERLMGLKTFQFSLVCVQIHAWVSFHYHLPYSRFEISVLSL